MNSPKTEIKERAETHGAFTVVELLVVIGTVALLAMMLLPALAGSRPNGQMLQCRNNLRQLQLGWLAYSADFAETICPTEGTANTGAPNWCGPSRMDLFGEDTDANDLQQGLLWPYVKSLGPYKCPADPKLSQSNQKRPTVRSVSMNAWMNPVLPLSSQGLSGPCRVFRKQGDISGAMSPAKCWTFLDENDRTINDGWCIVAANPSGPNYNSWVDSPATYHLQASTLAFADGHVEVKRWRDQSLLSGAFIFLPADATQNPPYADLRWLQERMTVLGN